MLPFPLLYICEDIDNLKYDIEKIKYSFRTLWLY